MIALLFLIAVAVWLAACIGIPQIVGNLIVKRPWRITVKLVIFFALISSPFVDEAIGKRQFEALCKSRGIEAADISRARGRKVKVEYGERTILDGTILPIKESDVRFRDTDSGEILIQHKNYYAEGGWLMRHTWLSMGENRPMLFGGSTCDLRIEQAIFRANGIVLLYK